MLIRIAQFLGIMPRAADYQLADNAATIAENVDLAGGTLRPLKEPSIVAALPDALRTSIFPYNGGYLSWAETVNVRRGPVFDDTYQRIYYTGTGTPKVRGIVAGTEEEYRLGVPKPSTAPVATVGDKGSVNWTRSWKYHYQEPDGTIVDEGTLTENGGSGTVNITTHGRLYYLTPRPAKVDATADAVFILYVDAYDENGALLGRCYPDISANQPSSDLWIAGARVTGTLVNGALISYFTFGYDTTRLSEYTIDRAYTYTYLTAWGEEGPPSDPSAVVAVDPSQLVDLSAIATPPSGRNITAVRIYRTITTKAGTQYQLMGEIATGIATYRDDADDDEATDVLPTIGWTEPPDDLEGLVYHPGGFFAGFVGRTLYMSEPYHPHAWPTAYGLSVDHDIVGLGVSGNSICILTTGYPYILTGDRPDTMTKSRIPSPQACISARSIVETENAVIYASPDGLCVISYSTQDINVITKDYYDKDGWTSLNPATMHGAVYDKRYHGWTTAGAIIFGLYEGGAALSTTTEAAAGAFHDPSTDTLLIIQGANIKSWRAGSDNLPARWQSRRWMTAKPTAFNTVRVRADAYPVTVTITDQDGNTTSRSVSTDRAQRFPKHRSGKSWKIKVETTSEVTEVLVSSSMQELSPV